MKSAVDIPLGPSLIRKIVLKKVWYPPDDITAHFKCRGCKVVVRYAGPPIGLNSPDATNMYCDACVRTMESGAPVGLSQAEKDLAEAVKRAEYVLWRKALLKTWRERSATWKMEHPNAIPPLPE